MAHDIILLKNKLASEWQRGLVKHRIVTAWFAYQTKRNWQEMVQEGILRHERRFLHTFALTLRSRRPGKRFLYLIDAALALNIYSRSQN